MHAARAPRLVTCALLILSLAPSARAQEGGEPAAEIRLRAQTPWTGPDDPVLRLTILIRNEGEATIADPEIGWILGPKVLSRVQYETSLTEGPAFPASAETVPLVDDLDPGERREEEIRIDTSETGGIDPEDSGVYPLMIELRSGGERVAAVTTAAIHLVQDPQEPVAFSWWTEVAAPVAFAPDGRLVDQPWETTLEEETGTAAQIQAIADLLTDERASAAFDVVVSPAALDQLDKASDGYRRIDGDMVAEDGHVPTVARETLRRLREIAEDPRVRLHAMPFAAPRLPALLASGLRTHLDRQFVVGNETFLRLMGERPDPTVARPPGLAVDQASVDVLEAQGATTILGAADSVSRPADPLGFAPPAAATLETSAGAPITIILPDPGAQAMLEDADLLRDPVRAAQAVLGELAAIWKEQPVPPPGTERGLALDLPPTLPGGIWAPLVRRVARAPFLRPVHAEDLAGGIEPGPARATLEARPLEGFSFGYVDALTTTESDVAAFDAMLGEDDDEAEGLQRSLLYATASQYVGNEGSGRLWIDAVDAVTDATFRSIAPDTSRVLTFTSRSGTIPLRMGDPGERSLNVIVQLASTRVDFLDRDTRSVRLEQANQVITFEAEVKAAGRSSIDVLVRSPSGMVLSRETLVVSSTAINPIALIITVAAGLMLIGLWSRRLFRRRGP